MQFKSTHQNVSGSDGDAFDLISKEMTMRGLKRSRSEPANFLCASASVVHNQELVFDNFSSTQMVGLWTPSMEDKLIGCINQINNKGQDMWSVIKEKMEEKGVKGFTTRQLENKYKSLKRKRSCSQDLKTHIDVPSVSNVVDMQEMPLLLILF